MSDFGGSVCTTDLKEPLNELNEKNYIQKVFDTIKTDVNQYFEPKPFERWEDGKIYRWLGVHYFKKIVPTYGDYVTRLIGFRPIAYAPSKEIGLRTYEKWTRTFEKIHIFFAACMFLSTMGYFCKGNYLDALGWTLINSAVNLYPVMLQRYNRARIYNALEKIEEEKI